MWILVILVMTQGLPVSPSVATAEFGSKALCEKAAADLRTVDSKITALCFKGDPE